MNVKYPVMSWPAERLARVERLRAEGLTFAQIGERFGQNARKLRESFYRAKRRANNLALQGMCASASDGRSVQRLDKAS